MKKLIFLLFYSGLIIACQSPEKSNGEQQGKKLANLPKPINTLEHQYHLAAHYWNETHLSDSISAMELSAFKQSLGDYLQLLNSFPMAEAKVIMTKFLHKKITSKSILLQTANLFEDYLYHPVSPLRNDELYRVFLEYKLAMPGMEAIDLVRTKYQLNIISKNNIGHLAENFSYTTPKLKKTSLFDVKSKYTLLYFYNPDCPYCKDTTIKMRQSSVLQQLISSTQQLRVLAICTEPTRSKWLSYVSSLPSNWTNGYNAEIPAQQLYDLRAIPSLYLLDKDKKVIYKDAAFSEIESALAAWLGQNKR